VQSGRISATRAHLAHPPRILLALWLLLVTASTLTTWQHQFIDVPTGAWAGLLVIAALPERRAVPPQFRLTLLYLAGAATCTVAAFDFRGLAWVLLWPAFALSMVAAAYWTGNPAWLGKHNQPTALLMLPYTAAAWINSRLWTRGQPASNHLIDAVWIGRAPSRRDRQGIGSVVVLAPELPMRGDAHIAMLDLSPPTEEQIEAAVRAIVRLAPRRPTLVCCALGYSRSAVAAAAWLMAAGHAADTGDAIHQVRRARPQVVIGPEFRLSLERWAATHWKRKLPTPT